MKSVPLLAWALTAGCALVESTEPTLPPDSVPIVLEHADAREVAATLDRLMESARSKVAGSSCALSNPRVVRRWREVLGTPRPSGSGKEDRGESEHESSFLALDRRTVLVLDAHLTDDYVELVRVYVATLDVPSNDD